LNYQIRLSVYDPEEIDTRLSAQRRTISLAGQHLQSAAPDEAKAPERSSESQKSS
jgi:hypothetical protein